MTDTSLSNPRFQFHRLFRFSPDISPLGTCYNAELPVIVSSLRGLRSGKRGQFLSRLSSFERQRGLVVSTVTRLLAKVKIKFIGLKSNWDCVHTERSEEHLVRTLS